MRRQRREQPVKQRRRGECDIADVVEREAVQEVVGLAEPALEQRLCKGFDNGNGGLARGERARLGL